jgi:glutamyl-tRNA synthetase
MSTPVRTRFAPSPTGFLHVGGIRTALFAWLVAKQAGGSFILRLEDTDKAREVEGSGQHIIDSLHALGLDPDEGISIGGPYAPYLQSERLAHYMQWAQKLIENGRAYADPYTATEVQAFREQAQTMKQPFLYRNHRPDGEDGRPQSPVWDVSQPLRFRSQPQDYRWHDEVMGEMHAGSEAIDDFVLIKSDGYPTYNFAHIVDDTEMKVSHVIRGQEFIASMPNYLNLYEALGITGDDRPLLATMPHILGPDGNKKLSKRDGAKDVLDYIRDGFLAEALVNFIASLGWNDGTEQEIFSIDELIQKFSLDKVQKSGARFDEQRLLWMNGAHIRELPLDELFKRVADYWPAVAADYTDDYRKAVLSLVQERLKYFKELPQLTDFFFSDRPVNSELISSHKQLKKIDAAELKQLLEQSRAALAVCDFSVDCLSGKLNVLLQTTGQKPAVLFSLIRIATTEVVASPPLAETLSVLGKERSLNRLQTHINSL